MLTPGSKLSTKAEPTMPTSFGNEKGVWTDIVVCPVNLLAQPLTSPVWQHSSWTVPASQGCPYAWMAQDGHLCLKEILC